MVTIPNRLVQLPQNACLKRTASHPQIKLILMKENSNALCFGVAVFCGWFAHLCRDAHIPERVPSPPAAAALTDPSEAHSRWSAPTIPSEVKSASASFPNPHHDHHARASHMCVRESHAGRFSCLRVEHLCGVGASAPSAGHSAVLHVLHPRLRWKVGAIFTNLWWTQVRRQSCHKLVQRCNMKTTPLIPVSFCSEPL